MTFSERLLIARKQAKLTQDGLAQKTGLDRSSINRYETGKTEIGIEALIRIAKAVEKPASWFLEEDPPQSPPPPPVANTEAPANTPERFKGGDRKPKGLEFANPVQAAMQRMKEAQAELAAATQELEQALEGALSK